jgi:hypothetical protein
MRNYRNLFEKEFSGCPRLFDMAGSGLPLGIKTLSMEEFYLLTSSNSTVNKRLDDIKTTSASTNAVLLTNDDNVVNKVDAEKLRSFILAEIDRLTLVRDILSDKAPMDYNILAGLIDECDYLWAHFPDYAASSRRPDKAELEAKGPAAASFLNRLRAEIDPFLKLWKQTDERREKKEESKLCNSFANLCNWLKEA